ncbi:MAG: alanine--tRNA ligase [Puniceicoccales bacterium]|jgi:alanyl-tRNA synthetase|nr:alanine--tRNA ligase [Puniceicoccales bacterium]
MVLNSSQLRRDFLDFFSSRGHRIVPSESLIPPSPNLLFTNAGMNQFVPYFLNDRPCPFARAANVQRCLRAGGKHNDLDDVGYDCYHHTFFEMLGNWSFGDYFKGEAIQWAWELLVDRWKFPKNRLYATVYSPGSGEPFQRDEEALFIWKELFRREGMDPEKHIAYGGAKDNFWMMGSTGPCGPCTEIHMDLTPNGDGGVGLVNGGSSRCMELWNLVFIQYNALADGKFEPLPRHYVDTGMGLERIAGIIANSDGFRDFSKEPSNYASDLFVPLFDAMQRMGKSQGKIFYGGTVPADRKNLSSQEKLDCAFRAVADHVRTLTMAIADGILPSNEGRGYVLRRILRRAVMFGNRLQLEKNFLKSLACACIRQMSKVYPMEDAAARNIGQIIEHEQDNFERTLDKGMRLLLQAVEKYGPLIPGEVAFELYDTYGFPVDLAQLIAAEYSCEISIGDFEKHMEQQRARARAAKKSEKIALRNEKSEGTIFVGYDGQGPVETVLTGICPGKEGGCYAIFQRTQFYGERGGQVGDRGTFHANGKAYAIVDTQCAADGTILHAVNQSLGGEGILPGTAVRLVLDEERRFRISQHHTAAHILQAALRMELGDHVRQAGSLVGENSLRFDFSHFAPLTAQQLKNVEMWTNEIIRKNLPIRTYEVPFDRRPAHCLALFGERYGEIVRVVEIGEEGGIAELCGGTHLSHTGEIAMFKILHESGIAAGVRRIEAICGGALHEFLSRLLLSQEKCAALLSCRADELELAIGKLKAQRLAADQRLKEINMALGQMQVENLLKERQVIGGMPWAMGYLRGIDAGILRQMALRIVGDHGGCALLICEEEERSLYAVACHGAAVGSGHSARRYAQLWNEITMGNGGGGDAVATGSFCRVSQSDDSLERFRKKLLQNIAKTT